MEVQEAFHAIAVISGLLIGRFRVFCSKPKLAEQDLHIQGISAPGAYFGNREPLATAISRRFC
jgi:hypothetical protein